MNLHLDERADGSCAFFIDGDLQFDSRDEAVYHESLALPALCLARSSGGDGLRVLICGGGDGLALRECLRFPGVAQTDLVDYDPEVVALGRTRFASLNADAFADPRVTVTLADAWEFLANATQPYDIILCDFTVPRRPEETRVFTAEWYARVGAALAPQGVAAFNAVSPQATPEAFWCLNRTVRTSGLFPLPYRVCIPSYRAQGYGVWAFLLAAHAPLRQAHLRAITCPVPTRQTDLTRLWRGARFSRAERRLLRRIPVHTLDQECLLRLLLNPAPGRQAVRKGQPLLPPAAEPYDLDPLLQAIPITHPYHTRLMVETLAAQVAGTVRNLDMQRLVDALLRRVADLPRGLVEELRRLRDFLRQRAPRLESLGAWAYKLFATLVVLLTLANAIAPDNAFAKGSFGLGHSGMSRGFSSSFTGARGYGSTSTGGFRSSFGGTRGYGGGIESQGMPSGGGFRSSFGGTRGYGGGTVSSTPEPPLTGLGFRRGYAHGEATDIYGYPYRARVFLYGDSGAWHVHSNYVVTGGARSQAPPEEHQALFVADDDMLVLDNGDVVVTLSDAAYLLLTGGTVALMSSKATDPLLALYPDPDLFQRLRAQLQDQQVTVQREAAARLDWLSWAGWTGALFPAVADDRTELRNLDDLNRKLTAASTRLGTPSPSHLPNKLGTEAVELFFGCFLLPDNRFTLCGADGYWLTTDGRQLTSEKLGEPARPCPPALSAALQSVLPKLQKEFAADIASDDNDLRQLATERAGLQNDLAQYQSIYTANGYQGDYEVDYGTEEIPVSDAIARTQRDLDQNTQDTARTQAERDRLVADLQRLQSALGRFGK